MVKIFLDDTTIDFSSVGERRITEYIFNDYLKNSVSSEADNFAHDIDDLDDLHVDNQKNIGPFIEELETMVKDITGLKLNKLSPNYLDEDIYTPPSINGEPTIVLSKIENYSIADLENPDVRAKLSGMGEWATDIENVSGKSTLPAMGEKSEKEYTDSLVSYDVKNETYSDTIERRIFSDSWQNITYESTDEGLTILYDFTENKKQILRESGVSILGQGKKKKVEKSSSLVLFKQKEGSRMEGIAMDRERNHIAGIGKILLNPFKPWSRAEDAPEKSSRKGLADITTDPTAIRTFFTDFFREYIGDILLGLNIKMFIGRKPSTTEEAKKLESEYIVAYKLEIEVTTTPYRLTETASLTGEGGQGGEASSSYLSSSGERMTPAHLNLSKEISLQEQRKQKLEVSWFLQSLHSNHKRLNNAIRSLKGRVNE